MTTGAGPRPWWNGVGFGLAALVVAFLVVTYVPPAPVPDDSPAPTSTTGRTITLEDLADELEAQLTDAPGAPPPSVIVETPEGPVTVVAPPTTTTTTQPPSTTTTTQPSPTTTTTIPRGPVPSADDVLDGLLNPRGSGGGP